MTERNVVSSRLPGGDLVSAVLHRDLMTLADRGGASNMVGRRWADLCDDHILTWVGSMRPAPDEQTEPILVQQVERLDSMPRLAHLASGRGLQNPDFLVTGVRAGEAVIQAADAKFSVETARSKQVSAAMLEALFGLRDVMPELFDRFDPAALAVPGVFICPDYLLTHLMMRRGFGIARTTVQAAEVALVPVAPEAFFAPLEGARMMPVLAAVDGLPVSIEASLLAGLYYFRLSRAVVGCWTDAVRPLLAHNDQITIDESDIEREVRSRMADAHSAIDLVHGWNHDVQAVREQRAIVDQAATLPVFNKDLRGQVEKLAAEIGAEPPSLNQVRRRLGGWWRGSLRDRIGSIAPPVGDLTPFLGQIALATRDLAPGIPARLELVVEEMIRSRAMPSAAKIDQER